MSKDRDWNDVHESIECAAESNDVEWLGTHAHDFVFELEGAQETERRLQAELLLTKDDLAEALADYSEDVGKAIARVPMDLFEEIWHHGYGSGHDQGSGFATKPSPDTKTSILEIVAGYWSADELDVNKQVDAAVARVGLKRKVSALLSTLPPDERTAVLAELIVEHGWTASVTYLKTDAPGLNGLKVDTSDGLGSLPMVVSRRAVEEEWPDPTEAAEVAFRRVKGVMAEWHPELRPVAREAPTVDAGWLFLFDNGPDAYAVIECFASGDIAAGRSDPEAGIVTWDVDPGSDADIAATLKKISDWLSI